MAAGLGLVGRLCRGDVLVGVRVDVAGLFGRGAHLGEGAKGPALLIGRQPRQDRLQRMTADLVDLLDRFAPAGRGTEW